MRRSLIPALLLSLLGAPSSGLAQEFFYSVYSWEIPFEGVVEPSLWTTYVANSSLQTPVHGASVPNEGFWAHSVELEFGVTQQLSLAGYLDFTQPRHGTFELARARVEGRYRLDRRGDHLFDTAFYFEYGIPRSGFFGSESLEFRLILEKFLGDFAVRLNPGVVKATAGDEVSKGLELEYAVGAYWRRYDGFQPGLEFYGDFGPISAIPALSQTRHMAFLTADLRFGGVVRWQLGAGSGLTPQSDRFTLKSILVLELQPSLPLGRSS